MDAFISARESSSALVIFLVAAIKYPAFQSAEERKTPSGSQFGAMHSILPGGKGKQPQGVADVAVVVGGLLVFGWTREQSEGRNRVRARIETVVPSLGTTSSC